MHLREDKTATGRWIPWVLALAVLFGWNAVSPERQAAWKAKLKDGIRLVDQPDDQPSPGAPPHPVGGLPPAKPDRAGRNDAQGLLLGIELRAETPRGECPRGAVQGRAPPAQA